MTPKEVYYSEYLQLDKILNAQETESGKENIEAHDEMMFIVVHQAYELWFKLVLFELESVGKLFSKPQINDNTPDLHTVVHRGERVVTILRLLVDQITIMETMTPLDFLDFRDMLRPASGFQSYQFKQVEALLGLRLENRHGQAYYLSHLKPEDIAKVQKYEDGESMVQLINKWLERMPFFEETGNWVGFKAPESTGDIHPFWSTYRQTYESTLLDIEKHNIELFDKVFFDEEFSVDRRFSNKANRAALFIMLYRDYPLLQNPFRLINILLEVDELMATWRYRHMNMVHRIIGKRVGTGKSTGKDYLRASMEKHYIFSELAELSTFLVERKRIPQLPGSLEKTLGFVRGNTFI